MGVGGGIPIESCIAGMQRSSIGGACGNAGSGSSVAGVCQSASHNVGIGGGTLFVPYLEAKKIDIRLAISSSSILGVVIGIGTLLGFVSQKLILETSPLLNSFFDYGNIYIKSFIFLTLPSIFTIFISTKLLVSLNQNIIKKLFAYLLISIGFISLFNL